MIRLCDGGNRLKAGGGHGFFPRRERRADAENRVKFPRWGKFACFRNHHSDHLIADAEMTDITAT